MHPLPLLFLLGAASAHMLLSSPPALGYRNNPALAKLELSKDNDLNAPLKTTADFPCKGHHLKADKGAGQSVATWGAGTAQSFTLEGDTTHMGGSCQVSFSIDNGASWKVAKSFIGGCPTKAKKTFSFTVPSDLPNGPALFAWTWLNVVGTREFYMNCAAITISGSSSTAQAFTSNTKLPAPFVANLQGNTCRTIPAKIYEYPNPGPDIERGTDETAVTPGSGFEGEGCGAPQLKAGEPKRTPIQGDITPTSTPDEVVVIPPKAQPTTGPGEEGDKPKAGDELCSVPKLCTPNSGGPAVPPGEKASSSSSSSPPAPTEKPKEEKPKDEKPTKTSEIKKATLTITQYEDVIETVQVLYCYGEPRGEGGVTRREVGSMLAAPGREKREVVEVRTAVGEFGRHVRGKEGLRRRHARWWR